MSPSFSRVYCYCCVSSWRYSLWFHDLMLLSELLIPYLDKWPVLKLHYYSEFPLLSPAPTLFQLLKWRKFPNNGGFWQHTTDRIWAGSKQPNYGLHFNSFNYNVNATVVDADTSRIFSAKMYLICILLDL